MEIKRYQAIGWLRGVIYFGIGGLLVLTGLVGLFHPAAETHQRVVGAAMVAVTVFIVHRLVGDRLAYGRQIAWYTRQGMAVLPGAAITWMTQHKAELEASVEDVIQWWSERHKDKETAIRRFLNGGQIVVLYQDEPIVDRRYAIKARELTEGNRTRVLWQPVNQGADFFPLLKHGIGHMCLTAMSVANTADGEGHHRRMIEEKFPDA